MTDDGRVFDAVTELVRSREHRDELERLAGARPPLTLASASAVDDAEQLIGGRLPALLRRLYLEVGNGGFGPGYGVLGVDGGHRDDLRRTAIDIYRTGDDPSGLLRICHWGCAIYSLVDVRNGGLMWGYDPNPGGPPLFPQSMSVTEWFSRWVDGTLHQPWLVEDGETGEWRGATDDEYVQALAERDADRTPEPP